MKRFRPSPRAVLPLALLALAACGSGTGLGPETPGAPGIGDRDAVRRAQVGSLIGPQGLQILSSGPSEQDAAAAGAIGVNSYLWRAALDTVSFMPVTSADPFGGVILTDWYTPPETPGERIKINVYVLDPALRADAVRVAIFRQVQGGGGWVDAEANPATANQLEETILTRARQLRAASLNP